jgi:hypothetical protein
VLILLEALCKALQIHSHTLCHYIIPSVLIAALLEAAVLVVTALHSMDLYSSMAMVQAGLLVRTHHLVVSILHLAVAVV